MIFCWTIVRREIHRCNNENNSIEYLSVFCKNFDWDRLPDNQLSLIFSHTYSSNITSFDCLYTPFLTLGLFHHYSHLKYYNPFDDLILSFFKLIFDTFLARDFLHKDKSHHSTTTVSSTCDKEKLVLPLPMFPQINIRNVSHGIYEYNCLNFLSLSPSLSEFGISILL